MSAFIKCPDCGETVVHDTLTDGQALESHRRDLHGPNSTKRQTSTLEDAGRDNSTKRQGNSTLEDAVRNAQAKA